MDFSKCKPVNNLNDGFTKSMGWETLFKNTPVCKLRYTLHNINRAKLFTVNSDGRLTYLGRGSYPHLITAHTTAS